MKKIPYILLALFAVVLAANADDDPITFNWAHSVDGNTKGGDNVVAMCKASDGDYYIATSFGSSTNADLYPNGDAQTCNFDGQAMQNENNELIQGSANAGNSYSNNLMLQKVKSDGSVVWSAYTNNGSYDCSEALLTPTSDGGVVLALKCRVWLEGTKLQYFSFYSPAKKRTSTYTQSDLTEGEYVLLVQKIKSTGDLSSKRLIQSNAADKTSNFIYVCGLTVGQSDSIYLAGNYRTDMKIGSTIFSVKNSTDWDGNSQTSVGDGFVIQMKSNTAYNSSLLADGSADFACFDNLVYQNGNLYLNGRVQNASGMTLGGKEVNTSGDNQTAFFASVSAGKMSVNYVKTLTSEENSKGKFVLQNKGAQYVNDKLYYTGSINGSFSQDGTTILDNASSGQLKPYVLQVDPETGTVEKAAVRTDGGIGNFYGVYVGEKDWLYAYGYDMSSGAILAPINKETYEVSEPIVVCKYGTVANATEPIVDGNNLVMAARGGNGSSDNNTATYYGTDKSFTGLKYWGTTYFSYTINDVDNPTSGISEAIAVPESATADVYTLNGIRVKAGVPTAEATQGLAKGIYIVGGKKVVVK